MSSFSNAQTGDHPFELRRKASYSKFLSQTALRSRLRLQDEGASSSTATSSAQERLWELMGSYLGNDPESIQKTIVNAVEFQLCKTRFNFDPESCYRATAYSIRSRLIESFNDTNEYFFSKDVKRCYYMSLEFLIGRAMQNALVNLDIETQYKDALTGLGFKLENLYEQEVDAGLGNGGLGRLAACFLDSMATLNYACWGYGIRYQYGIFHQLLINGYQVEHPDYWLVEENPWEIKRHDVTYAVRFGGQVHKYKDEKGAERTKWVGGEILQAIGYDNIIPGYDTYNCINLRLWKSAPQKEFDFESFNAGRYQDAVRERQDAEAVSAVLYPNDDTEKGKELRLRQQYFFCCASIQDALRRFKKKPNRSWDELPQKMAFNLNDTHPTIAIPELMRILIDMEHLSWAKAFELTRGCFHYTNHTVLPEALEKWPASLLERLLPRHILIINEINHYALTEIRTVFGDDHSKISRMSIYEEGDMKRIRMANLAVIGCNRVNGVAALHSELVKRDLFPEYVEFYKKLGQPDKFINVTNGVTVRRWMLNANRPLADLISNWLGTNEWLKRTELIEGLYNHVQDKRLVKEWREVKVLNKSKLATWVESQGGPKVDPETMLFDIQVKRIHEYKRQHLMAFWLIHRYLALKKMSPADREKVQKRFSAIGGKAAPGYYTAKTIVKLINNIARLVNEDREVSPYFKVYFLPNYSVSSAEIIFPGSDLSEQISCTGMEASGTGCMKAVMAGALLIGTRDGANVEIEEHCGPDTFFHFGPDVPGVLKARERAKNGSYPIDGRLQEVFNFIKSGGVSFGDHEASSRFCRLVDTLCNNGYGSNGDFYLVINDFPDYCKAQQRVDETYNGMSDTWVSLCIKATSKMGFFSSDRTIEEYARNVWHLKPCERPTPDESKVELPPKLRAEVMADNRAQQPPFNNKRTDLNPRSQPQVLNVEPTTASETSTGPDENKAVPAVVEEEIPSESKDKLAVATKPASPKSKNNKHQTDPLSSKN